VSLSRRSFLVGAGAGVVLAACGGSSKGSGSSSGNGSNGGSASGTVLARFFPDGTFVPGHQRLPIGLGDDNGIVTQGGPDALTAQVLDGDGNPVGQPVTATRHAKDIPRPYWPFELSLPTAGLYNLRVDYQGQKLDAAFSVTDPAQVTFPKPGDKLIPFDTPTTADARGVKAICTRNPACPLHDQTLTQALATGKPVVFMVSTPAFCQTASCGPVLDVLLGSRTRIGADRFAMVHAEVYADDGQTVSPTVAAYKLPFEPTLYLADATGLIHTRIDNLFDSDEVDAALKTMVA
jgi:hypothetical protein